MSVKALLPQKAYRVQGLFKYLITYDYMAGRKNRYTTFVLTDGDPVVLGRELSLKASKAQVQWFEKASAEFLEGGEFYSGSRTDVDFVLYQVKKKSLGWC